MLACVAAAFALAALGPEVRAEGAAGGSGAGILGEEPVPPGAELYGPESEVPVPMDEPGEMIEAEPLPYRFAVRPSLWFMISNTEFRKGGAAGPGDTFSLEDDFGAPWFHVLIPIEGLIRTENQEFRFRYTWWNSGGSDSAGAAGFVFGGDTWANGEKITAALNTQSFGVEFLQRMFERPLFDLFLAAGIDLFHTSLRVGGAHSGTLTENVPIMTVGLGMRFNVREDVSVFVSNTALTYSQLFGMDEEFFGANDIYRNFELSLLWKKWEKLDLGAGLRYYEVSFNSTTTDLYASQEMFGVVGWFNWRF